MIAAEGESAPSSAASWCAGQGLAGLPFHLYRAGGALLLDRRWWLHAFCCCHLHETSYCQLASESISPPFIFFQANRSSTSILHLFGIVAPGDNYKAHSSAGGPAPFKTQ